LTSLCCQLAATELTIDIVLNHVVLDHANQVTTAIVWADKSNRATTPGFILYKFSVISTMILVVSVKRYQRPSEVF
jgi:hypothetical protein